METQISPKIMRRMVPKNHSATSHLQAIAKLLCLSCRWKGDTRQLSEMNDRMLNDIGLKRTDIAWDSSRFDYTYFISM
ncbi:DUF1127 domain-containing protein [Phyllobacterium sp. CCNWLW11]|uniref:DUF1127 domain-containing protein n=1 Tax=unclassified Phyllobacterium TaxID=2638441 RepID=UPI003FA75F90